ncbi:MAG: methyltransferase type 11 [Dehalococcoidia bacterium]|nr:methyltransferase type 11 [Dehalococcoidia bacterium]
MGRKSWRKAKISTTWDPVAEWYYGWVGDAGSTHHRRLAIPALLELLDPQSGEQVLDIGAGHGVLASHVEARRALYTGVEASPRLLAYARRGVKPRIRMLQGDARYLASVPGLREGEFDAATFLLSIQDMDPLAAVLQSAAWALKPGGRLAIVMTHPCFRVPRQSGRGWDEQRKLFYRRVDRYLSPLAVPIKAYAGGQAATWSYHRPLEDYINGLTSCGLTVDCLKEIPTFKVATSGRQAKAQNVLNQEIPVFLALRALKSERR